ncbi:MAG: hypothetical protein ACRDL6_04540, partial [Solirubrobacterales bacterium]
FGFSSVEPGATFECKVDSGPFSPCTSPTTIGPLANGMHNFQVRARDLDNEVDPTPESRTFTVAVPPAPPTSLAPTITLPSSLFNFTVNGTSLQVSVSSPGTISVVDVRAPLTASIAKKKKRKRSLLLNPSSASGGPPTITVPLRLTKLAKGELRKKGKVTVNARITFTPQGGTASTRTAGLKVAVKKKGSKKRNRSASLFLEGPLDLARE